MMPLHFMVLQLSKQASSMHVAHRTAKHKKIPFICNIPGTLQDEKKLPSATSSRYTFRSHCSRLEKICKAPFIDMPFLRILILPSLQQNWRPVTRVLAPFVRSPLSLTLSSFKLVQNLPKPGLAMSTKC